MLTTRNVVTVVILVVLISVVSAAISVLRSPTGVTGRDSYGTHSYGFRGLFETLAELDIPVERELTPPGGLLDRDITLAIFEPDPTLVTLTALGATEDPHHVRLRGWTKSLSRRWRARKPVGGPTAPGSG